MLKWIGGVLAFLVIKVLLSKKKEKKNWIGGVIQTCDLIAGKPIPMTLSRDFSMAATPEDENPVAHMQYATFSQAQTQAYNYSTMSKQFGTLEKVQTIG